MICDKRAAKLTVADRVLDMHRQLSGVDLELPPGFKAVNPYSVSDESRQRGEAAAVFYRAYYEDRSPRRLLIGSSPARRGTSLTGVPFVGTDVLERLGAPRIPGCVVGASSSRFLVDVVQRFGGERAFYAKFLMGFVCPIGIVSVSEQGRETNANYYDSAALLKKVGWFLEDALTRLCDCGVEPAICYAIGSGRNFDVITKLNARLRLFGEVVPLPHPRYITQYVPARAPEFSDLYLRELRR